MYNPCDDDDEDGGFWGSPGNRNFSMNERQALFAKGVAHGLNQTDAAKQAGYDCTSDASFANAGARCIKHKAVVAALEAYEEGTAPVGAICTQEELQEILSTEARRGNNSMAKVKAAELLTKQLAEQAQAETHGNGNLRDALDRIGVADADLARKLGALINVPWERTEPNGADNIHPLKEVRHENR